MDDRETLSQKDTTSPPSPGPSAAEGRRRVRIERVSPSVDGGRYPVKRIPGEPLEVEADVLADGHEPLRVLLEVSYEGEAVWETQPMVPEGNDLWTGRLLFRREGVASFRIRAWISEVAHWQDGLSKKVQAGQREDFEAWLLEGAEIIRAHLARAPGGARTSDLIQWLSLWEKEGDLDQRVAMALDKLGGEEAAAFPDPRFVTLSETFRVHVERERALRGAWYEFFPRSSGTVPGLHGTLRDAARRLPAIAAMGFDVVYLPPIHPIGHAFRKGPNNTPAATGIVPGSPWAIGSEEGGHTAIDSRLGTMADFRDFLRTAEALKLEVALDLAFQCSPDHPYVRDHPEWFRRRPDGSIHYAENPPKKYQDIYPFDFLSEEWEGLWQELRRVVLFWVGHGIRLFRVDNPHTKPFPFWEWLMKEVRAVDPGVVFLAEAFTRPKVMYHLGHIGFSQSYTYFTWRNTRREIEEYLTELVTPPVRDVFRPNLWPNTPDILHEYLQTGGRPAFLVRLVLAATLSASYGIYGPAFEWCENRPLRPGSEEYLDSEKYEIRHWRPDPEHSLAPVIARINRIRRENPPLGWNHTLRFHPVNNDRLIAYSKTGEGPEDWILVVVNLDPRSPQEGWLTFDPPGEPAFEVRDLMDEARYAWTPGPRFIRLDPTDPSRLPFHIFQRIP
ncbi:MAG: alpha-1,4-glucan--maltose-1-phosphate maltosyltransferase [Nitrospiraceae bacterium]|nr:alpha-1,4-glucan--maltose-1-phosphate maltosyltransferase [Nitrospiraceae bacterium]